MFQENRIAAYLIIFIIACVLLSGTYALFVINSSTKNVNSFDDCVTAGNPIMESFPEKCMSDGKLFINNEPTTGL